MTINIMNIFKILKIEYEMYQELYELAQQKQDIIINEDIDELEKIVRNEEEFLQKIKELEEERLTLTDNNNLTELLLIADEPQKLNLDDFRNQIIDLTVKLKEQNSLNNKLINDSLALININMSLIKGNNDKSIYNKKGLVKQQASTFINKRA